MRPKGGLGNQLFQYAAARSLALRNQVSLLIDTASGFQADPYGRSYELAAFQIVDQPADISIHFPAASNARRQYLRWREYLRMKYCGQYFDPSIYNLRIRGSILLDNYCQSYRYFSDIEDLVRREFTFKAVPAGIDDSTKTAFTITNSVCLHARRLHGQTANGLSPKSVTGYYGACGLEYYMRALVKLARQHGRLQVFLFSDDFGWALQYSEQLSGEHGEVQVVEETDSLRCFFLMTQCKHFVIANSTYSWWAAWLGAHPHKTVCVPSVWNRRERRFPRDLFPYGWDIIDVK